jgi:TMEM175 potassium channel family protein
MYPRARFDALSDAIFGVAMTLLVLDLRLPEEFHPHDARALLQGLYDLLPKFFPYVLSFLVLGLRWQSGLQVRTKAENFGRGYFRWWLVYLLLITCVPFTTIVVGRFANLAPAIWLYAGNTALLGVAAFGLLASTEEVERDELLRGRQISLAILIGSSLLAIAWSFVNPRQALMALALNVAAPAVTRWIGPTSAAKA